MFMKEENLCLDGRSAVIFALQFFIRQAKKKIFIIIRKGKHNEDKNDVSYEYCINLRQVLFSSRR